MDLNLNHMFTFNTVSRWFAIHLDTFGSVFLLANSLLIVITMNVLGVFNPLLATIAIMYSSEMSYSLDFTVRFYNDIENYMTSS